MTSRSGIPAQRYGKLFVLFGLVLSGLILLWSVTGFIANGADDRVGEPVNPVVAAEPQSSSAPFLAPAQQSSTGGDFVWAKAMDGPELAGAWALTVDPAGNVYTTDYFTGTVDFDPGPGTFTLDGRDGNVFISKLTSNGDFVWARQVGGGVAHGIASDEAGNIYLAGGFGSTADFDPGPATYELTSTGEWDAYILKLNSAGNFVWVTQLGQAGKFDWGEGIETDSAGNVYVSGDFGGDIFVAKLDGSGNILWTKVVPGADGQGLGITVDPGGKVYVSGYFGGTDVDFDSGLGEFLLSSTDSNGDIVIYHLDNDGNFVWAKQISGPDFDVGDEIVLDAAGNIYVIGFFGGANVDFDPGPNVYYLSSSGPSVDIFVIKLNRSGDFVWAKQMGGNKFDWGAGLAVDQDQNIYLTGGFASTADFDPGPGIFNLTGSGSRHIFAAKLDSAGNFVWAKQMGDIDTGEGMSLALDSFRNVYFAGHFRGTVDFDPGPDVYNLTASGTGSIFVAKLSAAPGVTFAPHDDNLSLVEGASGVYPMQLNTPPTAAVTLTLTTDSQVNVAPTQLTITPLNWSQPQTVTVLAVADAIIEGAHTGVITHAFSSTDPTYDSLDPVILTVDLLDAPVTGLYLPLILK